MSIKFITKEETKDIISKGGLTVVNVYADWCGPCQMFAPILEELSNNYEVIKINVDEQREFAIELGVQGIPATFVFKDKKLVEKFTGFVPKEAIEEKLTTLA